MYAHIPASPDEQQLGTCIGTLAIRIVMRVDQLSRMVQAINGQSQFPALPVYASASCNADIFSPVGINQRLIEMVIVHLQFFFRTELRIIVRRSAPQQHSPLFQIQRHARLQPQASRQITPCRETQNPSSTGMKSVNGTLQATGVQRLPVTYGSMTGHVKLHNACHAR